MKTSKLMAFLALCVSHSAVAQAQTAGEPESTSTDVVVTGSRLVRDGSQAPTPVTAVTAETLLEAAPSNIPDALNKLPQFTGSSGPAAGGTFNAGSRPLGNYLNLRGLGPQRMLVLFDGQRVPPTTNTNAVDSNVLPQMLMQRVEIVTGGASAVYGSDAVSGVANFVLDTGFEGVRGTAQYGISQEGDAASNKLGVAFGKALNDRIHFLGSIEHYKNDGVNSLFDRDWGPNGGAIIGAGTNASPITVLFDTTRNTQADQGLVQAEPGGGALLVGNPQGVIFNRDGTLAPFNFGTPTPLASNTSIGGGGGVYGEPRNGGTSIAGTLKTDQAFGRFDFDLTDSLTLFTQGIYAVSETSFNSAPQNIVAGPAGGGRRSTIFADNPYLRPEVAALMTNAGQTSFSVGKIFNDIDVVKQFAENEYVNGQIGLKGDLGADWSWDANYVYGRATQDVTFNEFDSRRYFAALDAIRDGSGNIVCRVNTITPNFMPGCVPINIMGDGNITQAAFDYTRMDSKYSIVNEMSYANLNVQGSLFELPAGAVRVAAGVEYREQELTQTSNADPALWANLTTGAADRAAYFGAIRGVPAAALRSMSVNVGLANGTQIVREGYGELSIPLLKDTPMFQDLSVDLAARYTHYKTSGGVTTWKAGGSWTPVEGIRVRATQSRDIAAPSLFDLYAGQSVVVNQFSDPLTGLNQTVQQVTSGNVALLPEVADTTTVGVVLQPAALSGLTFSVDAYRIEIEDAFGSQGAAQMAADCHVSGGTAPVCALFTRPFPYSNSSAANFPTRVQISTQNLAQLLVQGVDLELNYTFEAFGGDVNFRAFASHLDTYDVKQSANVPVQHRAGRGTAGVFGVTDTDLTGLPKWKGLLSQSYRGDRLSLAVSERFSGSYVYGIPTQVFAAPVKAPNKVYVDLNVAYDFGENKNVQGFFNVQNVFNVEPPNIGLSLIQNLSTSTDKQLYDVIGRYFTTGVRLSF